MNASTLFANIAGGLVSGYLAMRTMDSLTGIGFCLHALITARWRHLSGRAAVRQVHTTILLRLMFQLILFAAFFGTLLYYGYDFLPREAWIEQHGQGTILYALAACATAAFRLPATRRRLLFFWRMTHEFDYAQRRQRTLLLKS